MSIDKTTTATTLPLTAISWSKLQMGQLIGSGGYGDVFKATWQGIEVAVKQLHLKTLSGDLASDFQREAMLMAQCQFPHVVRLYGVCEEPGHVAMVMEYLQKGSLYQVLHDSKETLPWNPIRWEIAIEIGKGLSYLHGQNIVHRDLKSLNVLLDNQYHAKITDFGLAKIKLESNTSTKPKGMGTTRWRAPELFKRGANPNFASDVYSYGMVLWEIASRQLPFNDAADDVTVMGWIKDGEQENLPNDCPKPYGEAIKASWNKEANQRPSAEKMVTELTQAKPKEEIKPVATNIFLEKSWHFDAATRAAGKPMDKDYELLPATQKDMQKVITCYQYGPVPGYEIGSVEVIYNPGMNRQFDLQLQFLQNRDQNLTFAATWMNENESAENKNWRYAVHHQFEQMASSYRDRDYPAVKLLPMWHGTKPQILDSLLKTGYVALATTDPGFFGNGIYSAREAEYSYRVYSQGTLILNWVACFSAYPVIQGDMQKFLVLNNQGKMVAIAHDQRYDARFAPVVPRDFTNPNENKYYPTQPNQKATYHELVVFQSAQCLPRYLVTLQATLLKAPVSSSQPVFVTPTAKIPLSVSTTTVATTTTTTTTTSTMNIVQTPFVPSPVYSSIFSQFPHIGAFPHLNASNVQPPVSQISPSYSSGATNSYTNAPTSQANTFSSGFNSPPQQGGFSGVFYPASFASPIKPNLSTLTYGQQVEAVAKTVQGKINLAELSALLKDVTEGHLVNVENRLKKLSTLALGIGAVTDLSGRTFNNITALQYAAWALDKEMCDLIMNYVGGHNSAIQLKALWEAPERYSTYGASYDITPLITKTETYLANWGKWSNDECYRYWQKEVGGEQRKCPAWLIYAWCEEGKDVAWPTNDFTRKVKREYDKYGLDWWFTENYNNGRGVGSSWAGLRGYSGQVMGRVYFDDHDRGWADCGSQKSLKQRGMELLANLKATSDAQLSQNAQIPATVTTTTTNVTQRSPKLNPIGLNSPQQTQPLFKKQSQSLKQEFANNQQPAKQEKFISALLKGDLEAAKKLESEGASLTACNKEGLYPFVAAVYGTNYEIVRYLEQKLGNVDSYWQKVDARIASQKIHEAMSDESSVFFASYAWLGDWYKKHAGKWWNKIYDEYCLKIHLEDGKGRWYDEGKWYIRAVDAKEGWKKCGIWQKHYGEWKNQRWPLYNQGDFNHVFDTVLICPMFQIHNQAVEDIRKNMTQLLRDVGNKASNANNVPCATQ